MRRTFAIIMAVLFAPIAKGGTPVNQQQIAEAQAGIIKRVGDAVDAYVEKIGIERGYISYCRSELDLKTSLYPPNGELPFGINYYKITDSDVLAGVVYARENFERSFIILCLANAKNALTQADRH